MTDDEWIAGQLRREFTDALVTFRRLSGTSDRTVVMPMVDPVGSDSGASEDVRVVGFAGPDVGAR